MVRRADAAPPEPSAAVALADFGRRSHRIVAFTGAGISTESGIPDYRGPNGVWATGAVPTLDGFLNDAETRRAYWRRRRESYTDLLHAEPNAGHRALAALAAGGRLIGVVTQNIDGLHQRAGHDPETVVELHGSAHRVRCLDCGTTWPATEIQTRLGPEDTEPRCDRCGGPIRAATVLFGEPVPSVALRRAADLAAACDLMLVVGSSLVVNPAAQIPLLAQRGGARLAILNRTPTPLDGAADLVVRAEAGPTLEAVVREIGMRGDR